MSAIAFPNIAKRMYLRAGCERAARQMALYRAREARMAGRISEARRYVEVAKTAQKHLLRWLACARRYV